jgi:hypothetical protein
MALLFAAPFHDTLRRFWRPRTLVLRAPFKTSTMGTRDGLNVFPHIDRRYRQQLPELRSSMLNRALGRFALRSMQCVRCPSLNAWRKHRAARPPLAAEAWANATDRKRRVPFTEPSKETHPLSLNALRREARRRVSCWTFGLEMCIGIFVGNLFDIDNKDDNFEKLYIVSFFYPFFIS